MITKEIIEQALDFIEYTLEFNSNIMTEEEKEEFKDVEIALGAMLSCSYHKEDFQKAKEFLKKHGFLKE